MNTDERGFFDSLTVLVEDMPLVELKCVERLANEHTAQCVKQNVISNCASAL
jgi:hypothetical protein